MIFKGCTSLVLLIAFFAALFVSQSTAWSEEPAKEPPARPGIRCLAFSPDGKLLAGVTGEPDQAGEAIVWSVKSGGVQVYHRAPEGIPAVAFSPLGKTLAIGGFTRVAKLLSAESGEVLREFRGHEDFVRCVAFADADTLVTGSYDKTLKIWNVRTGEVRATLKGHEQRVQSIALSADGKTAVTCSPDKTVREWDLAAGREKGVLFIATSHLPSVVRVPGSDCFVSSCWDIQVRFHEPGSKKPRASVHCPNRIDSAAVSADGHTLAVAGSLPSVQLFDIDIKPASDETTAKLKGLITTLDDEDYATREQAERDLAAIGLPADALLRAAFLESKSAEVRIRARRLREHLRAPEPFATLTGHAGLVQFVCFSPDGKTLATGDEHGEVRLWDVSRPKEGVTEIITLRRPRA